MNNKRMTLEIMEYVVWVVEIAARKFFSADKTKAYDYLRHSELWVLYTEHYDVTHTLGSEYILDEISEYLLEHPPLQCSTKPNSSILENEVKQPC